MSAFRFQIFLKDIAVRRFWNVWTRNYLVNTVVKRFKRDRAVREVIQCFKQVILRPRRTFLLSATAVCKGRESFNCDQGITDDELQRLLSDLENLQELAKLTIYCTSCGKRLLIDKKQNGVSYCVCKDSKPAQSSSDGWVPYIEADDVIIWRKEYKPGQGLYAYKVYGRYSDVSASDFAAVQIDGAYRRAWDSAVAALSVVQRGAHGVADQAVLHWEVLWPRLFANRDYVYVRRHKEFDLGAKRLQRDTQPDFASVHAKAKRKSRESYEDREAGNKVYIIVSKSCEHPDVPETKHAIRVTEYWSHMVVKSLNGVDKPGMEFVLTYYDEPAVGGMPGGVAAWASSRAAPVYLNRMRSAAQGYRSWAANRGKEDLPDFTPFGPDQVSYEEDSEQISEQDMESSKEGPDLENGVEKRDKGTQTESPDLPVEDEVTLLKVSHSKVDTKEEMVDEEQKEETPRETEVDSSGDLKGKETPVREGDGDKAEEDSNSNGSWWRYLYPFYYFV